MKNLTLALMALILLQGCDICENRGFSSVPSSNKQYKAVVFSRDCGATTGYSVQISIIDFDDRLPSDHGNIFIGDGLLGETQVKMNWVSDNELNIGFQGKGKIYKQEHQFEGIKINYTSN